MAVVIIPVTGLEDKIPSIYICGVDIKSWWHFPYNTDTYTCKV